MTIDIPKPPPNATAEEWRAWWEQALAEMETMVAMLERVELDKHNIPLDS